MQGGMVDEEKVRALLPWILMPRYRNAITRIDEEIEVYTADTPMEYFVPGAASMLTTRYARASYQVVRTGAENGDVNEVELTDVDVLVMGYLPDGRPIYFRRRPAEELVGQRIEVENGFTDFDIESVVSNSARLISGKYFAAAVSKFGAKMGMNYLAKRKYGIETVNVSSGNATMPVTLTIYVYTVEYPSGTVLKTSGVVPAVALAVSYPEEAGVDAASLPGYDDAINLLSRMKEMGGRFASIPVLHGTSRAEFTYVIGEVEPGPSRERYIIGQRVARGTRAYIAATPRGNVVLRISFLPRSPPAMYVMSFPPLSLSPLAAAVNDRFLALSRMARKAEEKIREMGMDGTVYFDELEVLRDARISIEEVRQGFKEGYVKPERVERLLDKLDRVGDIADVLSVTIGNSLEKRLVKVLPEGAEKKAQTRVSDEAEAVVL